MQEFQQKKLVGKDKIVLLGIFILSLLLAKFIVSARSVINLSEPIILKKTGLAVALPTGTGWQKTRHWSYKHNTFALVAIFGVRPGAPTTSVKWQYLLEPEPLTAEEQFKKYAAAITGEITETGQIQSDGPNLHWALIKQSGKTADLFLGIAQLQNQRWLYLRVEYAIGSKQFGEKVFNATAKSINFENNNLLQTGTEVVDYARTDELQILTATDTEQEFFFIEDANEQIIGFFASILQGSNDVNSFKITSSTHIEENLQINEISMLQGSYPMNRFLWKTRVADLASGIEKSSEIELTDNTITISSFGPGHDKTYLFADSAIPDALLDLVINAFLETDHHQIMVDLITSFGRIKPVIISKIDNSQPVKNSEKFAYAIRIDFLDGQGRYDQIYFNEDKKIIRQVINAPIILILKRIDKKQLLEKFPKWQEYILQLEYLQ